MNFVLLPWLCGSMGDDADAEEARMQDGERSGEDKGGRGGRGKAGECKTWGKITAIHSLGSTTVTNRRHHLLL